MQVTWCGPARCTRTGWLDGRPRTASSDCPSPPPGPWEGRRACGAPLHTAEDKSTATPSEFVRPHAAPSLSPLFQGRPSTPFALRRPASSTRSWKMSICAWPRGEGEGFGWRGRRRKKRMRRKSECSNAERKQPRAPYFLAFPRRTHPSHLHPHTRAPTPHAVTTSSPSTSGRPRRKWR